MSAFGGKADVNPCVGECPLLAKSGHSLVRQVLLGVLGPDRLGAGLHLCSLGTAASFVQQSGIVLNTKSPDATWAPGLKRLGKDY